MRSIPAFILFIVISAMIVLPAIAFTVNSYADETLTTGSVSASEPEATAAPKDEKTLAFEFEVKMRVLKITLGVFGITALVSVIAYLLMRKPPVKPKKGPYTLPKDRY